MARTDHVLRLGAYITYRISIDVESACGRYGHFNGVALDSKPAHAGAEFMAVPQ